MIEGFTRPTRAARGAAGRLAADRRGNFAILFAFASVVVAFAASMAVDVARAYGDRTRLENALDAAVLATTRALATDEIGMAAARSYLFDVFRANAGINDREADRYRLVDIVFDDETETLSATAVYDYETAFAIFGEAGRFPVSTRAGASYGGSQERVEVAMTFDVTGSMARTVDGRRRSDTKLEALQDAARLGITQLLSLNKDGKEIVRVAAIPYAEAVNVGPLSRYVWEDDGRPDDRAPAYDPDQPIQAATGRTADCATERKSEVYKPTARGPDSGMINRDGRLSSCPSASLVPLTGQPGPLLSAIDSFRASGTTAGHIGIQWAWYTLSHAWARYMPAGPAEPIGDKVKKYAIIMTDGEFNTAYAGVGRRSSVSRQSKRSADYAVRLCDAMKAEGIEVFTIGFALTETRARQTLRECASPPKDGIVFFHEAASGDELAGIYADIAAMIQTLRLVQ